MIADALITSPYKAITSAGQSAGTISPWPAASPDSVQLSGEATPIAAKSGSIMKKLGIAAATCGAAALTPVPAFAASAPTGGMAAISGAPGIVKYGALFAAGLGFLLGSVPKNDGWGWDMTGALCWGAAAGLTVGGAGLALTRGLMPGALIAGAGVTIGLLRIGKSLKDGPVYPSLEPLKDGINSFDGADEKKKFKAAKHAYNKASFDDGSGRYATRGLKEWSFGEKGAGSDFSELLKESLPYAEPDTFDILVLLTRDLPAANGDSAVVVVRGARRLRSLKVDSSSITLPSGQQVPLSSIRSAVGYAWR